MKSEILAIGSIVMIGSLIALSYSEKDQTNFEWKNIRPEIQNQATLIADYGKVTQGPIGYHGEIPKQSLTRKLLMNSANEYELNELKKHPNGVVKVTAYEALVRKPNANQYELVLEGLNDTSTLFGYQSGCTVHAKMIGEYLMEDVVSLSNRIPPLKPAENFRLSLTKEEISRLRILYNERFNMRQRYISKNLKQ